MARAVKSSSFSTTARQETLWNPEPRAGKFCPTLARTAADPVIRKAACDALYETDLARILGNIEAPRLIITGCATDFCVDTTVRSAASRDYDVTVASDAHTTADRPHLKAPAVIQHHNWVWENLILPRSRIKVVPTDQILKEM